MQQSPSLEANRFSASQEIPHILWNLKVHYCIHLSLSPVPLLNHINPAHCPQPISWRSIFILSSHLHLSLPSGLLPSGFLTTTLYVPLLSPIYATCPANLILLDLITWIIFGEEYRSLSSSLCGLLYSQLPCPLRPKYPPQHPILIHLQPTFLPECKLPGFTPIQNNRVLRILIFIFLSSKLEEKKDSTLSDSKHSQTSVCFNFFLNGILIC